jgi:hypothetical protein
MDDSRVAYLCVAAEHQVREGARPGSPVVHVRGEVGVLPLVR